MTITTKYKIKIQISSENCWIHTSMHRCIHAWKKHNCYLCLLPLSEGCMIISEIRGGSQRFVASVFTFHTCPNIIISLHWLWSNYVMSAVVLWHQQKWLLSNIVTSVIPLWHQQEWIQVLKNRDHQHGTSLQWPGMGVPPL